MNILKQYGNKILVVLALIGVLAYTQRPVAHRVEGYGLTAVTAKTVTADTDSKEMYNQINISSQAVSNLTTVAEGNAKNISYLNLWLVRLFGIVVIVLAALATLGILVLALLRRSEELEARITDLETRDFQQRIVNKYSGKETQA